MRQAIDIPPSNVFMSLIRTCLTSVKLHTQALAIFHGANAFTFALSFSNVDEVECVMAPIAIVFFFMSIYWLVWGIVVYGCCGPYQEAQGHYRPLFIFSRSWSKQGVSVEGFRMGLVTRQCECFFAVLYGVNSHVCRSLAKVHITRCIDGEGSGFVP